MIRKIFDRIWRTFIIVVNTAWNLFGTIFVFVCLFDKGIAEYNGGQVLLSWIFLGLVNLTDLIIRKHFKNY